MINTSSIFIRALTLRLVTTINATAAITFGSTHDLNTIYIVHNVIICLRVMRI